MNKADARLIPVESNMVCPLISEVVTEYKVITGMLSLDDPENRGWLKAS